MSSGIIYLGRSPHQGSNFHSSKVFWSGGFSENNGIIQITGIGSRYIGYYIAGMLSLLGLFPMVGGVISLMPDPVLGGATIVLFGTVAAVGIKIMTAVELDRRSLMIIALSLGVGLGISFVPEILASMPTWFTTMFASGIASGGLVAIFLNLVIPANLE